jgi:hypothetical protein
MGLAGATGISMAAVFVVLSARGEAVDLRGVRGRVVRDMVHLLLRVLSLHCNCSTDETSHRRRGQHKNC